MPTAAKSSESWITAAAERYFMGQADDDFQKKLRAIFKIEAQEHIQAIASGLVEMEQAASLAAQTISVDAIFRSAHSLKGAARSVNETDIESVCRSLETTFAGLKRKESVPSVELFDLLHKMVNSLGELVESIDAPPGSRSGPRIADLTGALDLLARGKKLPAQPSPSDEKVVTPLIVPEKIPLPPAEARHGASETVRVSTSKLDAVLLQGEELLSVKLATGQHAVALRQLHDQFVAWQKNWAGLRLDARTIQQSLEKGDDSQPAVARQLANVMEFLEWNRDFIKSLEGKLAALVKTADHDHRSVEGMLDNLLAELKQVAMLPFSTLLDVFPRFVRELSRNQGKEVELVIRGGEIEIDRRILEEMKAPLIHLMRNCLDHGIEPARLREQQKKAARATITIGISAMEGGTVELLITDDGAGINVAKVKAAALKTGILAADKVAGLGDQEALTLIFQAGISTSPAITDLSGHGLGLAIVKEKVEKLNGLVSVASQPGKGTSFRVILPLTLARFRGVIVRVSEQLFVLPTHNVERVVRIAKEEIKMMENRETVVLLGQPLSLVHLGQVLGLQSEDAGQLPVLVLTADGQRMGFVVQEVLHEEEVLVKPLGRQLVRVRNITGATILGTGKVVPVLNVHDLIKSAVQTSGDHAKARAIPPEVKALEKKTLLVAEDSITARTLLKNILETAGYTVETAVDGMDAFTKLRNGKYDLLISDVDMPRLNGVGLTVKIRTDKKLSELPVVLVTALESRENREQGIEAGANAYIIKSSFDQSNLLEIIRRLI